VAESNSTFDFTLSPLYGPIDPQKSSFRVTPRKIEITLGKKQGGKWSHLEWTAGANPLEPEPPKLVSSTKSDTIPDAVLNPGPAASQSSETAPAYPTSSRNGPKNWDKIGDDDEDEEDANPDDFFKKLYKNADDDTKKAMMKSMQESGGTSLSTVWSDVKSKTFTPEPPEGMVANKW
jgi:suppressor of G2 allele of SKP1